MKRTLLAVLFTANLLLVQQKAHAQLSLLDSLFAKGDSTAVMDSLMAGFDAFLDSLSQPKSFLAASVGMGNRTFSIKNNALNAQEGTTRQLSFTPTLAFYHKTGLGISGTGFLANLNNHYRFYQYAITPSYDYITKKVAAGISYTRYLGKDTATLHASPYDDDWYGYFYLRRKAWRFGIAAGYAAGSFNDNITYADSILRFNNQLHKYEWRHYSKTVASSNHLKDFSLQASVRRDFEWYGVLSSKDNLALTVAGYLVTGASRIKTSANILYTGKRIQFSKFKRSYSNADGNSLQLQSGALSASLYYTIGKYSVQPIWFVDYYFQDTEQKFSEIFSLTVAYNF